jgi:hypothetical protein
VPPRREEEFVLEGVRTRKRNYRIKIRRNDV